MLNFYVKADFCLSESLYYLSLSYSTWVYSNVYCYLCNTNSKIDPSSCQNFTNAMRFRGLSLFTLINQHIWKGSGNMDDNMLTEKKPCMEDEILDTFFVSLSRSILKQLTAVPKFPSISCLAKHCKGNFCLSRNKIFLLKL